MPLSCTCGESSGQCLMRSHGKPGTWHGTPGRRERPASAPDDGSTLVNIVELRVLAAEFVLDARAPVVARVTDCHDVGPLLCCPL